MTRTLSIQEALLLVAYSYRWVRERPRNSNQGEAVEHFLATVHLQPGQPWCAAYVSTVGSVLPDWPLPLVGGCATLGERAEAKGLLRTEPAPGAIFLLHYPKLRRFAHTGFCVEAGKGRWKTIEGNTGEVGQREGWGVFEKHRQFGPQDRFVYWWDAA